MKGLSKKQLKAIEVFRQDIFTIAQVAKAAGVSTRTLFRWMNDPVFKAARAEAEEEMMANWRRAHGIKQSSIVSSFDIKSV